MNRLELSNIYEEDVSWNVSLEHQLVQYAKSWRPILPQDRSARSPYGGEWDILSTGHCDADPQKGDMKL